MNRRVLLIAIIVVMLLIIIVSLNSGKQNKRFSSGDFSGETMVNEIVSSLNVPERFKNVVNGLYEKHNLKQEDYKSKETLTNEFELDAIGEYEGILIKNENPDDYKEIALIALNDISNNDNLLLKMIRKYETIKSNYPNASYLRESKNVCIKIQGGVAIFIVANDAGEIYNTIVESKY